MPKEFDNAAVGYEYFKSCRSALARFYKGKWMVFSPAYTAIGHISSEKG